MLLSILGHLKQKQVAKICGKRKYDRITVSRNVILKNLDRGSANYNLRANTTYFSRIIKRRTVFKLFNG
jgi:hypothetical protein